MRVVILIGLMMANLLAISVMAHGISADVSGTIGRVGIRTMNLVGWVECFERFCPNVKTGVEGDELVLPVPENRYTGDHSSVRPLPASCKPGNTYDPIRPELIKHNSSKQGPEHGVSSMHFPGDGRRDAGASWYPDFCHRSG